MKTREDPRHHKREQAVKALFASGFFLKKTSRDPAVKSVLTHRKAIDALIAEAAPAWPLPKINRIDLAILRLATWELTVKKQHPHKVIIDEAVELAKQYGAQGSPGFVNGVLGSLVKSVLPS